MWTPATRVCLVLLLLNAADGQNATLATAYLDRLGYPLPDIGVLVSLYAVAALVSRLPSGRLAEGRHADRWMLASCATFGVALVLYPVAVQPWHIWLVRVAHGLSFGAATTLCFASLMSASTGATRSRDVALYTACWAAGYSIGNFVAGFLADELGFGIAFVSAAVCPLAALLIYPRVPLRPTPHAADARPRTWRLLFAPDVRVVPLMAFSVNFLNALLTTLFPLYVLAIGQTLAVVGTARALQSVTNTIVRPLSAPVVRRVGVVGLGAGGVALSAVAIGVLPFSTLPVVLLALFVIVGVGRAVGIVANASGTVELSSRGVLSRGTASALMSGGGDAGSIVAPLLAGATAARIGIGPALQLLAAIAAVVTIGALLSSRARSKLPSSAPLYPAPLLRGSHHMQIAIGTYDHTKALKDGSVSAPGLSLDFVEVAPITRAFRNMAAQQAYDVAEMALVTYMLARVYHKPIVGLPIVLVRSTLLPGLVTAAHSPITDPKDLNGKTLGIRSYTQTSGVWVRGILQDGFGVDLASLKWVTFEGAHLDEYRDPASVTRAPADANIAEMVKSGDLAAAIGVPAGEGIRSLVPNAAEAEAGWAAKSGVRTVNHILTVRQELVDANPGLCAELTELFQRARGENGVSVPPIGIEPNRQAFETLARFAYEQGITPRELSLAELFPYS